MSDPERAAFNAKITAAGEIGVDRLSVDKLLRLMGWKADVKSVMLGSGTARTPRSRPGSRGCGAPARRGAAAPGDAARLPSSASGLRPRTAPTGLSNAACVVRTVAS